MTGYFIYKCIHWHLKKKRIIYEICLKNNMISAANNLFQLKTTNYLPPLQSNPPSSLIHFSILVCHASTHVRIDFGYPQLRRYVPFDGLHVFKIDPLDDPLEHREKLHTKQDQVKQGNVPVWRCSSRPEWSGALSWWSNHNLSCHNIRRFSRTEWSKRRG